MPHPSNAELTVASLMPGLRRLNRPPDLGGVEAAIFRRTVAAVPASRFAAEDMVLSALVRGPPLWSGAPPERCKPPLSLAVSRRLGRRRESPSSRPTAAGAAC